MNEINAYFYIIGICLLVIISYLYNLFSSKSGIPSVLLLLLTGILTREILLADGILFSVPQKLVEVFGILGLIMILLEAGLDLQVNRNKIKLIRNSFFSALFILLLSSAACASFLYFYLEEPFMNCMLYALPLSVVSSAIVIPGIAHLSDLKKEFLVYETSFSDILGILLFNYLVAGEILNGLNIAGFFGAVIVAVILSLLLSFFILLLLTRITTKIRFFLVFAVLILLYAIGKMMHLPALFIILLFGLVAANWNLPLFQKLYHWIQPARVKSVHLLLHSITAESSFLIRTFFFFIFGFTIDIRLIWDAEVILAGGAIVVLLFGVRYIYLRFFLRSHILPELFYMPRGLITVLLFYSIPETYKLSAFNEGILFFVILVTSILMVAGSVTYGRPQLQVLYDETPLTEMPE
jgi:Kef-type K+ transport system membrane component KefB